jgi:hypothetical protein
VAIRKGSNHHPRTWVGKPLIVPAEPGDLVAWSLGLARQDDAVAALSAKDKAELELVHNDDAFGLPEHRRRDGGFRAPHELPKNRLAGLRLDDKALARYLRDGRRCQRCDKGQGQNA